MPSRFHRVRESVNTQSPISRDQALQVLPPNLLTRYKKILMPTQIHKMHLESQPISFLTHNSYSTLFRLNWCPLNRFQMVRLNCPAQYHPTCPAIFNRLVMFNINSTALRWLPPIVQSRSIPTQMETTPTTPPPSLFVFLFCFIVLLFSFWSSTIIFV